MAHKRKRPKKHVRFRDEVIGLACVAAAAFLAVALVSYRAADPNPFDLAAAGQPENLAGRVGATFAAASFQLAGVSAYLPILALLLVSRNRLWHRKLEAAGSKLVGLGVLLVSSSALASLGFGDIRLGGALLPAGGLLGSWSSRALLAAFGAVGGPLVALTGTLLATVVATRLSFGRLFAAAWKGTTQTLRRARTSIARRREQRRKARQRRAVVNKHAASHATVAEAKGVDHTLLRTANKPILKVKVPVGTARPGSSLPQISPPVRRDLSPDLPPADEPPLPFEQPAGPHGAYALPESHLLEQRAEKETVEENELMEKAKAIASKGAEFNVTGEVVAIHPGPVVTTYEFKPSAGVKYSRIINLEDDLSLALRAESIRIARLPGKSTVGIEAPNSSRQIIRLREIIESKEFASSRSKLSLALGRQIHGETAITDLARMPHLLIAGTTGSGKSVALNSMLLSLL
ncbi:MAG: DNA translocase FtsK 4TM domain-containing protein, partial [Acidobacteriota bacterium]